MAALTEKLNVPCLLPPLVYEVLRSAYLKPSNDAEGDEVPMNSELEKEIKQVCVSALEADRLDENKEMGNTGMEALKIKEEQFECNSLIGVRSDLKLGKGNFVLIEGLIYHKDKLLNETVMQLVLPENGREKVLQLAHESVFGSHMGIRKTKERIRYNFYWPNMSKDIAEYCKTCKSCQLRGVEKITDRAPITAIARPSLPFEVVNIDIIGKIEPPSGRGHHYVLCLMDQHTRWPEAIPLRSISAKATCDALLKIFTRTGIPNIIASDRGTNFTSALTQEFMKRIGSSPRLSTPGYPASNG